MSTADLIADLRVGAVAPNADAGPDAGRVAQWREWMADVDFGGVLGVVQAAEPIANRRWASAMLHLWLLTKGGAAPGAAYVWFNLGVELNRLGDANNAIAAYANALALKSDFWQAAINGGSLLEATGQQEQALATWRAALQPDMARVSLLNQQGRLLEGLRRLDEAESVYYRSLLTLSDQPQVIQHWAFIRQNICAWPLFGPPVPGMTSDDLRDRCGALATLSLVDTVAGQRRAVQSWLDGRPSAPATRLAPAGGYAHDRLRIGYMSSDFCRHPMSYLIVGLLERHDRTRFEVFGYCSSPEDGSDVRIRVLAALDHCRLVRPLDDAALARQIRDDEIDILIDLNGITVGERLGVLRWKPAPVQATYLGFIGPVPVPELDYILTDDYAVPPDLAGEYWPRPLYLPDVYQANDGRMPALPAVSRDGEGLPADRFIFCCFSNPYKISEAMFDAWMDILIRAGEAVLWLLEDNPWATANMRARAAARGLAGDRLLFAQRTGPDHYRARMALADLFLDTNPYNAGTIASDALRVGLPLLTLPGETFASRMAGSLLRAMGLPDLIAQDRADYIDKAVRLATDAGHRNAIRARVTPERWRATLGNTERFARGFEETLLRVAVTARAAPHPVLG